MLNQTQLLEAQIRGHRMGLQSETDPIKWGIKQNNLAFALCRLGALENNPTYAKESVDAYRTALQVRTREIDPSGWAVTQHNLGLALYNLDAMTKNLPYLQESIHAYRTALQVRTRESDPSGWLTTQCLLGVALNNLGQRTKNPAYSQESVDAYYEILQVQTRAKDPVKWAIMQNNLGMSLASLGFLTKNIVYLQKSVDAYRRSLEVRTQKNDKIGWGVTQNNIAGLLSKIGKITKNPERLQESINIYRAALQVRARERDPSGWARTQGGLGASLGFLGRMVEDRASLLESVKASRAALEFFTRERSIADRAQIQDNLGCSLGRLGWLTKKPALLKEAATACQEGLQLQTREESPSDWAMTQEHLGFAFGCLGRLEKDPKEKKRYLQAGAKALNAALEINTREKHPCEWEWEEAQDNLDRMHAELDVMERNPVRTEPKSSRSFKLFGGGKSKAVLPAYSDIYETDLRPPASPSRTSEKLDSERYQQHLQESQSPLLAHIESSPELKQYRDYFQQAAHSFLISATALSPQSGRAGAQPDTSSSARVLDIAGRAASAAGKLFPVPGMQAVGSGIQYVAGKISEHDFNQINTRVARLVKPNEFNAFCKSIADSATLLMEKRLLEWHPSSSIIKDMKDAVTYQMSRIEGTAGSSKEDTLERKLAADDACKLLAELARRAFERKTGSSMGGSFDGEPLSEKIDIAMEIFCGQQNDNVAFKRNAPAVESDPSRIIKRVPTQEDLQAVKATVSDHRGDVEDLARRFQKSELDRKTGKRKLHLQNPEVFSDTASQFSAPDALAPGKRSGRWGFGPR